MPAPRRRAGARDRALAPRDPGGTIVGLRARAPAAADHGGDQGQGHDRERLAKAPQLLDALQKNIHTDMSLSDMKAIYDWGKNLPDSSIIRIALTAPAPATDGNFLYGGNCGLGNASQLCAEDPSYRMIHQYISSVFVD